uniref:Uncharacterized protein n=1 Tax=Tanacetum cinerariifolium TaxID=118510 RepID=A0A699HM99_TANCI|nr:hypothetical protein [Tanacetum cinerariifolium]
MIKQTDYESSKKDKDQAGSSKKDDVLDVEDPTQADVSAPKQHRLTWFKTVMVERPELPDPEWRNEPTVDDAPEQTWFNEMVNAEKNQQTFDVVMGLIIDFTNFTKNCLKKNKITKVNLKGDRIPHDYRKPLPLHGALGHLTIPVDFFFNKDLEYLRTRNVEKKYATSLTKLKAARYNLEGIKEMIPQLWSLTKVAYDKDSAIGISH